MPRLKSSIKNCYLFALWLDARIQKQQKKQNKQETGKFRQLP